MPIEGLLETEFQALYNVEREKMIKYEFGGLDQDCCFSAIWSETAIGSYFSKK